MKLRDDGCADPSASARGGVTMRLTLLAYLATIALGCVLAFYSLVFQRVDFLAGAVVAGGIALLARSVLRERRVDSTSGEIIFGDAEISAFENEDVCDGRVDGLVKLLHQWDKLEQARGSASFDPWALQSVRSEIRTAVYGNPMLEKLLRDRGRG